MIADSGTWMMVTAGIALAVGAYLIGYALFKMAHRSDKIIDRTWAEFQRVEGERLARGFDFDGLRELYEVDPGPIGTVRADKPHQLRDLYDQETEPFTVPTTWPVICRQCEAPLRLEEVTPGAWFWKHRSRHLDLQHRPDAVPAVTP
jgi:hypothetical protein